MPIGLEKYLREKINLDTSLIMDLELQFPGCSDAEGVAVTEDGQFFSFEVDLSADKKELKEEYEWIEVTADYEVCDTKRGIGHTDGYIALTVLKELNDNKACQATSASARRLH